MRQINGAVDLPQTASRTPNVLLGSEIQVITQPFNVEIRAVIVDGLAGVSQTGTTPPNVYVPVDLANQYCSFKIGQNELSRQALDVVPRYLFLPTAAARPSPPPSVARAHDEEHDHLPIDGGRGDTAPAAPKRIIEPQAIPTLDSQHLVRRIGISDEDVIYQGPVSPGNLFLRFITTAPQPAGSAIVWDVKYAAA